MLGRGCWETARTILFNQTQETKWNKASGAKCLIWFHISRSLADNNQGPTDSACCLLLMLEDTPQHEQTWHLIKIPLTWWWSPNQADSAHQRGQQALWALFYFFPLHLSNYEEHNTPILCLPKGLIVTLSFLIFLRGVGGIKREHQSDSISTDSCG